ncbi:BRCA1-A complex subunit BRE [Pteropus alecto]|uniref:BRISC and BRCA1-A complex member 2 n=1 Tax=Pteropus alecto TaxID=9402 RepID=L5KS80_PTEAL|nr:BRCA1-A complex subunit BRE [Pteropus alecto]
MDSENGICVGWLGSWNWVTGLRSGPRWPKTRRRGGATDHTPGAPDPSCARPQVRQAPGARRERVGGDTPPSEIYFLSGDVPRKRPTVHPAWASCCFSSSFVWRALGGSSALHIPAFPGGGCLIDYVPQVCHLLTNKVQYVIQGYHKRREYIAAFLSHFGTGVVEYDAEGFTKLTLLLMWKDFCFLVHIDLPLFFPRDQPTLTFQSVYHFTNSGQLYSQAQKNYPYSPRWDGNEMAKRAK